MKEKKPNTYKTNHPTIKEISIGDKFVLNNGEIVTFVEYDAEDNIFPIRTNGGWYTKQLSFYKIGVNNTTFDINYLLPTLKDKLDLL